MKGNSMRNLKIFLLLLVLGGMLFYNSNWFQSIFLPERFYKDIFNAPFDVTKNGESISIPLKYKYKTCYALEIAVPDKDLFHNSEPGNGLLKYSFVSNGRVIDEGLTYPPNSLHMALYRGITSIIILVFDLPFNSEGDSLTLDLEVIEPMRFLEPFSGKIHCKVSPSYDAKLGKCHGESTRIVH